MPPRRYEAVKKTKRREAVVKKMYRCRKLNIFAVRGRSSAKAIERLL